jgi:hypothetical protein
VLEAICEDTIPVLSAIPEHLEIVGAQYPFLVSLEGSPSDVTLALERALDPRSLDAIKQIEKLIAEMTDEAIAYKYVEIFVKLAKKGRS